MYNNDFEYLILYFDGDNVSVIENKARNKKMFYLMLQIGLQNFKEKK